MLDVGGGTVPLLWVQVSRERDIYLGFGGSPTDVRVGTHRRGEPPLQLAALARATDQRSRVSFHASGVTHLAGKKIQRPRIPDKAPALTHLCSMMFADPSVIASVEPGRRYDLALRYPVEEHRPLGAYLYAATPGVAVPPPEFELHHPIRLEFQFNGLSRGPDCCVGMYIGSPADLLGRKWPRRGSIVVAHPRRH